MSQGLEASYRDEHKSKRRLLGTVQEVDSFIDDLLVERHDRNCALIFSMERSKLPSGFFDHELAVGVDRTNQMGVVTLRVGDDNFASQGSVDRGILEYMLMGHVREFMPNSEISIGDIREVVKEFLLNGGKMPTCIEWQMEEF